MAEGERWIKAIGAEVFAIVNGKLKEIRECPHPLQAKGRAAGSHCPKISGGVLPCQERECRLALVAPSDERG
jgi:hypothetical protein